MIETSELTKVFGGLKAVDHLSLKVQEGEIFGLLGPNGAGKTTFISMLCTLLTPTSGTVIVGGYDVQKNPDKVKKSIGVVFQGQSLDDRLTGRENLQIQAVLYGMPKKIREKRIGEVLDFVGLKDRGNAIVKTYSGGMRRRLEIARGLIHRPRILLLDEPTLGLDPQGREDIWRHIEELEDITVFLATNYMDEADRLCDRVGIINDGKLIVEGTPQELKDELEGTIIYIRAKNLNEIFSDLQTLDFVNDAKIRDDMIVLTIKDKIDEKFIRFLNKHTFESVDFHKPTLNDVFLKYVGRGLESPETDKPKRGRGKRRGMQ
ncbi:MAG: ATP-binding cassette domain-containing protein [Thermodesulfobacteriota bacterium]